MSDPLHLVLLRFALPGFEQRSPWLARRAETSAKQAAKPLSRDSFPANSETFSIVG